MTVATEGKVKALKKGNKSNLVPKNRKDKSYECHIAKLLDEFCLARVSINVTEMWTTATSVPKRGCPPLVLDKVLRSEYSETLARVCKSSPDKDF